MKTLVCSIVSALVAFGVCNHAQATTPYNGTGSITLSISDSDTSGHGTFDSGGSLNGGMTYHLGGDLNSIMLGTNSSGEQALISTVSAFGTIWDVSGHVFTQGTFYGSDVIVDNQVIMSGTLVSLTPYESNGSVVINLNLSVAGSGVGNASATQTIPEPCSLALLGFGATILGLRRR